MGQGAERHASGLLEPPYSSLASLPDLARPFRHRWWLSRRVCLWSRLLSTTLAGCWSCRASCPAMLTACPSLTLCCWVSDRESGGRALAALGRPAVHVAYALVSVGGLGWGQLREAAGAGEGRGCRPAGPWAACRHRACPLFCLGGSAGLHPPGTDLCMSKAMMLLCTHTKLGSSACSAALRRAAGVGPDGHVASLFPNRKETAATSGPLVLPVTGSPKPPSERITLTLPVLNAAKNVLVVALGEVGAAAAGCCCCWVQLILFVGCYD